MRWLLGLEDVTHPEIENPDWTTIYQALISLDGEKNTNLSLILEGTGSLSAGGGDIVEGEKRYIVVYQPENDEDDALVLTDPSLSGDEIELTVQTPADFPSDQCVRFSLIEKVFKHFYETGKLPSDVPWEV
jgi:hypothetical protein